mmetsp:Transcript_121590/g.378443  ORF Transcript_121590/g.378443 Transcript_121590/m.378443 type:complete len:202 (-) Transcript_121590:470-1075(-)
MGMYTAGLMAGSRPVFSVQALKASLQAFTGSMPAWSTSSARFFMAARSEGRSSQGAEQAAASQGRLAVASRRSTRRRKPGSAAQTTRWTQPSGSGMVKSSSGSTPSFALSAGLPLEASAGCSTAGSSLSIAPSTAATSSQASRREACSVLALGTSTTRPSSPSPRPATRSAAQAGKLSTSRGSTSSSLPGAANSSSRQRPA